MLGKDTILQYLHVRNTIDCSTMPYSNTDGQTGSGKSFSMVGSASDKGIIPRVCHALFHMIDDERRLRGDALFKVEASYLEIYNASFDSGLYELNGDLLIIDSIQNVNDNITICVSFFSKMDVKCCFNL